MLVLSFLMKAPGPVSFTDLRRELALTDGTLSVHLSKLADGGILSLERKFVGKRPQTKVRVTPRGRAQFRRYVQDLRTIIPGLE